MAPPLALKRGKIVNGEFDSLQMQVRNWLKTCESDTDLSYVMASAATEPTLMTLSFAILIHELFALLPHARSVVWAELLQAAQDTRTGLFHDPKLHRSALDPNSPGLDYLTHQTTYFALAALDALQEKPLHRLSFALQLSSPGNIVSWLERLDWTQPWAASNWVMFLATDLHTEWQWYDHQPALEALHTLLDWLDKRQDPRTGFWGTEAASLDHAMAATYHFLPFYFCLGRELHYVTQMIDHTLALQAPDGLFHPDGGGDTCLDVDAVDILVKCSSLTPHRAAEVEFALERAYAGLLSNQSPEGGFCRARNRPLPPKTWKRRVGEAVGLDRLLSKPYVVPPTIWNYSGWRAMPFDVRQGDLWSTWFRPFGLAVISARYPEKYPDAQRWVFRRLPALGWHDAALIGVKGSYQHDG